MPAELANLMGENHQKFNKSLLNQQKRQKKNYFRVEDRVKITLNLYFFELT